MLHRSNVVSDREVVELIYLLARVLTEVGPDVGVGEDPGEVPLVLHLLEVAPLVDPHRDPPRLVSSVPQTSVS